MTATLSRFEFAGGYPTPEAVMGIPEPVRKVAPGDNVRAMKLWAAVGAPRVARRG